MNQKKMIAVAALALGGAFLFTAVYQQFSQEETSLSPESSKGEKRAMNTEKDSSEPETLEDVFASIQAESDLELSALDEEADGEMKEVEADSESVNNLGTSYDESSL